ncbi:MAG: hypothetical protein AAF943_08930 [Pseudomonadota bacterium]
MVAPPRDRQTDAEIPGCFHDTTNALGYNNMLICDFLLEAGVRISPPIVLRIVADCPTCVMLKPED